MKNTLKNRYRCACIFLCMVIGRAALVSAQDAQMQEPRGMLLQHPPTPALEAAQSRFQQQHGGTVLWNPVTRLPASVSQMKTRIAPTLSRDTVDTSLMTFIQANRDLLGISPSDLSLLSLQTTDGKFYAKYIQTIDGIPVEGNEVGCILDEDGFLTRYASSVDPSLSLSTKAGISNEAAVKNARTALENLGVTAQLAGSRKIFVTQGADRPGSHNLVYRVFLDTDALDQNPHQLVVIDAGTGAVLSKGDATPWSISGTVSAEVFPDRPTDPTQTLAMPNLNLVAVRMAPNLPGMMVTGNTSAAGKYSLGTTPGTWNLTVPLSGSYAKVSSVAQAAVSHSASLQDGAVQNVTWNAAGGSDLDQLTIYYHINRIHDELYRDTIGYGWVNSWTGTTQFPANTGYSFGNAYSGSPMAFGANNFSRSADVIYHECTHNVLYTLFNGWIGYGGSTQAKHSEAYAFDEGFADFFAAVLVNRATSNGRNLDNTMDYAANYTISTGQGLEGHTGGQVISGAAWDLRGLMQAKLGANQGSRANVKLVFKGLQTLAADPRPYRFSYPGTSNLLDALLRADDNNNNLSDGTPWDCQIFQAFRNHGLLPVDVFIADRAGDTGDVPSNPNGETWWISPDIYVDAPPFSALGSAPVNESPEPNQENRIRVMVRNAGYLSASNVKVALYAMNLLASPEKRAWSEVGSVNVKSIPVNGSLLSDPISWIYKAGEIVMAKLITADDPVTEPYSVANENNLAQRNYAVFLAWAGSKVKLPHYISLIDLIDPDLVTRLKPTSNNEASIDILRESVPDNVSVRLDIPESPAGRIDRQVAPITSRIEMAPTHVLRFREEEKPRAAVGDEYQTQTKSAVNDLDRAFAAQGLRPERPEPTVAETIETTPGAVERLSVQVDSYPAVPVRPQGYESSMVSLQVPDNARPGEVYLFHVISKLRDKVVGGVTYEVRIVDGTGH
ncbi:MAG: hypothetical protein KJ645_10325 [Planctomycetes bacterium]|nr:hypothetical protein [Planctomycetota bacterium]